MRGEERVKSVREGALLRRGDAWVFFVLAILVAALTLAAFAFRREGAKAEVRIDGELVAVLDLSADTRREFRTGEGYNLVVVKGGKLYVEEADCADGICIRTGKISHNGEAIVCLPHGLTIEIVSGKGGGSDL